MEIQHAKMFKHKFPVYFRDLCPDAQDNLCKALNVSKTDRDLNVQPLFVVANNRQEEDVLITVIEHRIL